MTAAAVRSTKANRLAQYYLKQLQLTNAAYKRGGESSTRSLQLFEQEWPQIRHWQAWAAQQANRDSDDSAATTLCNEFGQTGFDLLALRVLAQERLAWREASLEAALRLGDKTAALVHLTDIASIYGELSVYDQTKVFAEQGLHLAQELGDRANEARNLNLLSQAAIVHGEYAAATDLLEQALKIQRTLADKTGIAAILNNLGIIAVLQGEYLTARDYLEQSLAIYRVAENQLGIAKALNTLGNIADLLGNSVSARQFYEQSLSMMLVLRWQMGTASVLNNLGVLANVQGDHQAARDYHERSLAIQQEIGNQDGIAQSLTNLGQVAYDQEDYAAAHRYYEQCLSIWRTVGYQDFIAESLGKLTMSAAMLHQPETAAQSLADGLKIARDIQAGPTRILLLTAAAVLWLKLGKAEVAATWLGAIISQEATAPELRDYIAKKLTPELETSIPTRYAEAMERGKALNLDEVINQILSELGDERN
jgi:tetratricopeptide (TPR) repeat protein